MINIKFSGKRFKIYYNNKIKCLEQCSDKEILQIQEIIEIIDESYQGPQDGFPISRMAELLPNYGVEVISYHDYEMENAPPDRIY